MAILSKSGRRSSESLSYLSSLPPPSPPLTSHFMPSRCNPLTSSPSSAPPSPTANKPSPTRQTAQTIASARSAPPAISYLSLRPHRLLRRRNRRQPHYSIALLRKNYGQKRHPPCQYQPRSTLDRRPNPHHHQVLQPPHLHRLQPLRRTHSTLSA